MGVKYPLTGGLDLTTVKPLAKPGTLKSCLNFEVSTVTGYTLIGGLARFDGSEDVGAYKIWRLKYAAPLVNFTAGQQVWWDDPTVFGFVLTTDTEGGNGVVYLLAPAGMPEPALPQTLNSGSISASILQREAVFEGYGTQDTFDTALASIETQQRDRIGQVPGRAGSDIIGGFFYKDRVYAIRDLPRISFQNGYYTDADEGKYIIIDGSSYKILDVTLTGDNQGTITYDTATGAGTLASPIGSAELVTLPVTGDYDGGYTNVPYTDDLDVSGGVPPYKWSLVGTDGLALDPVEAPDANAIDFLPQLTNAALYRSGTSGWTRVDLGRELQFRAGTASINNFKRTAVLTGSTVLNTGVKFPTTGKLNGATVTSLNADDGVEAALAAGSFNEFQALGFSFASIPDTAAIQGIEVVVERHSNTGNTAKDHVVDLIGIEGGTINKAKGTVWPSTIGSVTYGGSTDLWGSQHITPAALKAAGFGVRVIATKGGGTDAVGGVDYISIKVYYIERDTKIYCWDGTTDVEFTLHHTQIISGATGDSTAQGYMSVTGQVNSAKPRLVNEGDQIRTAAGGLGNLLGVVAGRDKPLFLAGQGELDHNRARYQFLHTNFYGQDEFDAVYGVCGASPAFSFDGTRCVRIRTELPAYQDLPRHIARHGDMLVLGFYSGALVFTPAGDPHETRGSAGAVSIEVGDRLVGIEPLAGDALGIVCQSTTQVIRGITPESMMKAPIAAKRGGIEYTLVDMGRVVLCDGLGIFLADSPESFGAARRNYISQSVHSWLRPRLQASLTSEASYLRPVAAINVRHKNQMRLYFWDGWVLTMTNNEPAEFTTQRYFSPAPNDTTEPTPWVPRMLCSGIDSAGRERVFCSFFGGVKEGYVFEIDASRSFDGEPIPAHFELNPLTVVSSSQEKRYDRCFLYGHGYTHASLTHTRRTNDDDTYSGTYSFKMGKGTKRARLAPDSMRGVVDKPTEAFDVSIRLASNTSTEGPFTIQYVEFEIDDRGVSRGRQGDK